MTTKRPGSAAPQRDEHTGTWWFIIDVGTIDGRRKQARRRGFPTKKAAQQELDRLRVSVTDRTYVAPRRQTLTAFVEDDWLPAVKMSLEESTWSSYARNLRRHVLPRIGDLQLTDIDAGHLNRMYAELRQCGNLGYNKGGPLSPRTVRYVATILGEALGAAVEWDRLARNPAQKAKPPRAKDAKAPPMKTWTGAQLERFLALAEGNRYHPAWFFLATTGVRRGEALGLRWSEIDFDASTAALRATLTAVEHQIKVNHRTKTDKDRVIELDIRTIAILKGWRATQAQEPLLCGAGYHDEGYVFCHPDGRPYHPERFSREFKRMIERHQLDRIRLHDLRHTWATLALKAGIPLKVVSERLGHATTAITADIYSHVTPGMQSDAAERVAALIFTGHEP
jgi:integrase